MRIKNLKIIKARTSKQKGDIAGTKLKKFFDYFSNEVEKEFEVKKSGFEYDENKNLGIFYLSVEKKKEELRKGPSLKMCFHFEKFKKKNKDCIMKNGVCYAKIKHDLSFEEWLKKFKLENKKIIKEMSVVEVG